MGGECVKLYSVINSKSVRLYSPSHGDSTSGSQD